MLKFAIAILSTLVVSANCYFMHSTSSSQYIHSNDTIKLSLSPRAQNTLYGAPNSQANLEFLVENRYTSAQFSIRQSSEDGFQGFIENDAVYVSENSQQYIQVTNMRVPNRPEGSKVKFTLRVTRESGYNKREQAPPNQGGRGGGVGGSGSYPGSNPSNPQYPSQPNFNDPSFRMEVSIQVEFTVTSEGMEDDDEPSTELTYMPDMNDQYCPAKAGDSDCDNYYWWVKIAVEDEDSGLNAVEVEPEGKNYANYNQLYYRYSNWPVGTNQEHSVAVASSCCIEKMVIRITDTAGNTAELNPEQGKKGTPMEPALMWGLIGGAIALVLIIVIVGIFCYKKKYSPVSTGD